MFDSIKQRIERLDRFMRRTAAWVLVILGLALFHTCDTDQPAPTTPCPGTTTMGTVVPTPTKKHSESPRPKHVIVLRPQR